MGKGQAAGKTCLPDLPLSICPASEALQGQRGCWVFPGGREENVRPVHA